MKISHLILSSLILVFLFYSCTNYKLSSSDLKWNPYQANDNITFVDKEGNEYQFKISKIEKITSRTNPYAGTLSKTKEDLIVFFTCAELQFTEEEQPFLVLSKNSDNISFLQFPLQFQQLFFPSDPVAINELNSRKSIKHRNYKDVISFNSIDHMNEVELKEIKKIYWSKKRGYIQFDFKDGDVWTIKD